VNAFVVLNAGLNLDQAIGDMAGLARRKRARKIDRRKVENVVVLERQLDAEDVQSLNRLELVDGEAIGGLLIVLSFQDRVGIEFVSCVELT
jgi:hypothetical protein